MRVVSRYVGLLGPADWTSAGTPVSDEVLEDLDIDQVFASFRVDEAVARMFRVPLPDGSAVRYRQDVFRDLENESVRTVLTDLADATRRAVAHRRSAGQVRQAALRHRLHLSAVNAYLAAIDAARDMLSGVRSDALQQLRAHIEEIAQSGDTADLRGRSTRLESLWSEIRFALLLHGAQIVVAPYDDEPDLTAELEEAFAPFRSAAGGGSGSDRTRTGLLGNALGSVDGWILDAVAEGEPRLFDELAAFARDHDDFVDAGLERFASELGFFTEYRDLMSSLRGAGVPFVLPTVSGDDRTVDLRDVVDLGLSVRMAEEGHRPVGNDLELHGGERILVVSGPNQGGKSTTARTFGQIHLLASIGCPVPASAARLPVVDQVLTLFPREERLKSLAGGLGEEVQRVHSLFGAATERSVLVLNEVFASTTAEDARVLLTEVVRRIEGLGALAVCVTFLDEVARLGGATVSMVAEVDPADPSVRTFTVVRRPADGRAYAHALAERHRLTADAIRARIIGGAR